MSDVRDDASEARASNVIRPRIESLRELIGLLSISPVAQPSDDDLSWSAQTFQRLSERLGRLLGQAGMADCVRAVATLEHAGARLPDDESVQDVDAALAYLRARVLDVTLPNLPTTASTPGTGDHGKAHAIAETLEPGDGAAEIGDLGADERLDVATGAAASTMTDGESGQPESLDESQYSGETLAIIRDFQTATLRQRSPGEFTREPRPAIREISDEIPEHLKREFLSEAAGDLSKLRALIASFDKMPGTLDDLHEMERLGHKVKGTADTYLYPRLADVLHSFESMPQLLRPVAVARSQDCLNILSGFADVIEAALHEASEQGDASAARVAGAESLVAKAQALVARQADTAMASADGAHEAPRPVNQPAHERVTAQLPRVLRGGAEDVLRVEPLRLDSLMHQSDSLAMKRAVMTQTSEEIYRVQSDIETVLARLASLSAHLNDLHSVMRHPADVPRAKPSAASDPPGAWDDPGQDLSTDFDESLRALSEAVTDVTTLSSGLTAHIQQLNRNSDSQRTVLRDMQQTIIGMRLVSLKSVADRLVLATHQVAQSEGKRVQITITGQGTRIDRNISESLIAPLLQLVRNAVSHGIESPHDREARGKPATGNVWMHASYSGNEVNIEVGDDGRGVNPHQLIAAAVSTRILDAKHADYLTRDQALKLMFEPNLSTTEQAGVISGHGIGLDGVQTAIQRLRGTINVRSDQGRGTVFRIRVPISLSIARALRVRVNDHQYGIPLSIVHQTFSLAEPGILVSLPTLEPATASARFPRRVRIARPSPEQPLRLPDDPTAALYDEVPVFSLAELLGLEELPQTAHTALLVDAGQRQVVILVDEVFDESEVVIRALPAHLRRQAVRGASVMSDGRLFLVLDLADLLTDALGGKMMPRPQSAAAQARPREHTPIVLVVDDSISMRRALEATFRSAGYDVRVARDGVEALGVMVAELPDIMVLDIEMPRLDGFELLSVISANETFARVPVLMLTSRAAEKHHRLAMDLGARGYLTKPCPDDVLIATLQRLLREQRREP